MSRVLCVISLTIGLLGSMTPRGRAQSDAGPLAGWDFRFKGFVIGAWWGPEAVDAEMDAYKQAGYNVVMIGRYMTRPDSNYNERFGTAALIREQLDFCKRHKIWAMIDTYTPNDRPWGGVMGQVDGHSKHHACSFEELQWICKHFADHPAVLGILLGDDKSQLNQRMSRGTKFLRENHPGIMPWICQNSPNPASLAEHGNPIFNPQIYPTLYQRENTAQQNALSYCGSYAMMRRECQRLGLLMWPMWNASSVSGDSLIRFPIYAALAYGAQGYWTFKYHGDMIGPGTYLTAEAVNKAKTRKYNVVKKANHRVLAWAPYILGAKATRLFSNIKARDSTGPGGGKLVAAMDDRMLIGVLERKGHPPMAMIVDARVSRKFQGLPRRSLSVTFGKSIASIIVLSEKQKRVHRTVPGNQLTLALDAGEGQLVILRPR